MGLTAGFTDFRRDLTKVTNLVMNEGVQVTVFKHNKPAFKIVPVETPEAAAPDAQGAYLASALAFDAEYHDLFDALASERDA